MLSTEADRAARPPGRTARALATGAAAALLAVAGCGDEEGDGENSGAVEAQALTFVLDPDGDGTKPAVTKMVACPQDEVCPELTGLTPEAFGPVEPGVACTQIYGGPDELQVEGTIDDEPVEATFTRANGCEIERFERMMPVVEKLFLGYEPGASLRP